MKHWHKILPWIVITLFLADLVAVLLPKREQQFHTLAFGRLPVLMNGRIQPFDSVGRNALLQIRSTGDVPLEIVPSWQFWRHPRKLRATDWLLELMCRPAVADTRPVFLIHHPELLSELKLTESGIERSGLRYYSFRELQPLIPTISARAEQAGATPSGQRTSYQQQVLKLANALWIYERLKHALQPAGVENFSQWLSEFEAVLPAGLAALHAQRTGAEFDRVAFGKLGRLVQQLERQSRLASAWVVPPDSAAEAAGWTDMGTRLLRAVHEQQVPVAVKYLAQMATAYGQGDPAAFNEAVHGYRRWLAAHQPVAARKAAAEQYYNQAKFFLHAMIMYLAAFVLAAVALLSLNWARAVAESLRRAAFWLVGLAFVVHTAGLAFRMALEGRPPVTNLYSSAVFIGWGACALGLVLERTYRLGLGSAVAGLAGFVTLLIAHNLALGGDTMEMLRAVLDTNFWLAAHVVTITLGYSAAFVAGGLGVVYVLLRAFTPLLGQMVGRSALGQALANMVYGTVCFALLFSVLGTVLGGIWADQAWGRFWGWDPKENGALMIVLWYAIILHALRAGLVGERGLMNLAIFGNVITAFSWFGTNMLGVGLHSYGFMDAGMRWLVLFIASQLLVIGLGLLPLQHRVEGKP